MSDLFAPEPQSGAPTSGPPTRPNARHRPPKRKRSFSWLAGLLAFVVLVAVIVVGGVAGYRFIKDHVGNHAPDYAGPGTGKIMFQVNEGDTVAQIGRNLEVHGVVKSVEAFLDAAQGDPAANGIQVGYYGLKEQMKASDALAVLENPDNLVRDLVVIPEGQTVANIVKSIVEDTDLKKPAVIAALENEKAIGLPPEANGNPEGYLFPATYTVAPGETAVQLIAQMVAKTKQVDDDLGLTAGAKALNLTPHELITVASILEHEAKRSADYPKVARAIYNRLQQGMPLQVDATVDYANGLSGEVWTTEEQRNNPSPYNTSEHTGLPPGPIGNPGEETLKAALHPADGTWLYWVTVNLATGKTVFSTTLAEHNKAVEQLHEYCQTSGAC
jgi:UPF0755 protein